MTEKQKLHIVERKKHFIEKISFKDYAIYYDDLNDLWYLCYVDKNNAPICVYDGSKESINNIFNLYVTDGVINFDLLEKDDSI